MKKQIYYMAIFLVSYYLIAKILVGQIGAIIHIVLFPLFLCIFQYHTFKQTTSFYKGCFVNLSTFTLLGIFSGIFIYFRDKNSQELPMLLSAFSIFFFITCLCWVMVYFVKKIR